MTQPIVGVEVLGGVIGTGDAYTYLIANDGVYIAKDGEFLHVKIPIAGCEIRGLSHIEPSVYLKHGKIPGILFDLALNCFLADPDKEQYLAVTWSDGSYHLMTVNQERKAASVEYEHIEGAVLDLHSHCNMSARFSAQDDKDETGFRIYGVVGKLETKPEVMLRVGVYGYFYFLKWDEVFSGTTGVSDVLTQKELEDVAFTED